MRAESTVLTQSDYVNKPRAFHHDLGNIDALQAKFNEKLKTKGEHILGYNPVLERANWERLQTDVRRHRFIDSYEPWQVETAMRERNHAAKSSVNYVLDENDEIRNELFPDEPFRQVLERGVAYRASVGSQELEREVGELHGWLEIMNILKDPSTPDNATFITISPPGIVKGTTYTDNFVDTYTKKRDPKTGKITIKMVRNASKLTYGDYEHIAPELQPGYFDGLQGPIDAWYLSHPIYKDPIIDPRTDDELFEQIFGKREGAMSEKEFNLIWKILTPVVIYYINALCAEEFDPEEVAIAWNAVVKKNDLLKRALEDIKKPGSAAFNPLLLPMFQGDIRAEVNWLGRQKIDLIAAACGMSGGFEIKDDGIQRRNPAEELLSNSVAKFGLEEDKYGSLHFDCPHCHEKNKRDHGKLIANCKHCGEDVRCDDKNKNKTGITK